MFILQFSSFWFLFQIDKKIVRTEIGVLLRLSHPNIVSVNLQEHGENTTKSNNIQIR